MKQGSEYLEAWGAHHPDVIGASEYRAIYDCLADALTGCEEEVADEPLDFALAILQEFREHADGLIELLEDTKAIREAHDDGSQRVAERS